MDPTGNFSERFTLQRDFKTLTLRFDGGCSRCNPDGNMGFGWQILNGEQLIAEGWGWELYTGARTTSNNLAEFIALNTGLLYVVESDIRYEKLEVWGDSAFVIAMAEGRYRIGLNKGYTPAALEFEERIKPNLDNVTYNWCSRDYNTACDELAGRYFSLLRSTQNVNE